MSEQNSRENIERAIGRMIMAFNHLELNWAMLLAYILPGDRRVSMVVGHALPFRFLRGACTSALAELDGRSELHAELVKFASKVEAIEARRGTYAHSAWTADQERVKPQVKKTFQYAGSDERDSSGIEALIADIEAAISMSIDLVQKIEAKWKTGCWDQFLPGSGNTPRTR